MIRKIVLSLVFLGMAEISEAQKIQDIQWLLGSWKVNLANGVVVEQWSKLNDSTFCGKNYFVKVKGDSVLQETVLLQLREKQWKYIPVVENQNNKEPVVFSIIFMRGSEFIAENLEHDFPQRIAYRRIGDNLYAHIEGKKSGKFGKQNFDFVLVR